MNTEPNHINPFDKMSGSANLAKPKSIVAVMAGVALIGLILAKMEVAGAGLLMALLFVSVFVYKVFQNPALGFYATIGVNFLVLGIGRYVQGLPLGFAIDGLMILTFLAVIFKRFRERVDWSPANQHVTVLATIWLGYFIFQIANPEARMTRTLDCR